MATDPTWKLSFGTPGYGVFPREKISQRTIPKLQTSDWVEKIMSVNASCAIHLMGSGTCWAQKSFLKTIFLGCRYSSVDLSAPSILSLWVRVPSTPSMLLSIYIWIVSCGKDKNKQKEVGLGPFFNKTIFYLMITTIIMHFPDVTSPLGDAL